MISNDRHYRHFQFELRNADDTNDMVVKGRPAVFNTETVMYEFDGVQYKEIIDAEAFSEARMDDVVFNIDHQGKPAAKTKNGTLQLHVRADGLYMEADLSQNATGRELYEDIRNGFYDKMSFAFSVEDEDYNKDIRTRTVKKVKRLFDVSAVSRPAYEATSIQSRSWAEAQSEIDTAEAENIVPEGIGEAEATRQETEVDCNEAQDRSELMLQKERLRLEKNKEVV